MNIYALESPHCDISEFIHENDRFRFYVYAYLRKDGTPYYIGKGCGYRAWNDHRILKENGYYTGVQTPKDKSRIILLETNLSNIGALALERRYIEWYGRKDLNTGILHNKTDGGESPEGVIPWNKGRTGVKGGWPKGKSAHNKGKPSILKGVSKPPLTNEHRQNISKSRKGKGIGPRPKEHFDANRGAGNHSARCYQLTDPNGTSYIVTGGLRKFCLENCLTVECIINVAKNRTSMHKGWIAKYLD